MRSIRCQDQGAEIHSLSDLFFRELHLQPKRVGEAVCKIGQSRKQMDIDDLRL